MAVIKCKMCGGDMTVSPDKTYGICDYCGSTMTLPKIDNEQRAAAFNRGNHFRRAGEFDRALAVYERIVVEDDTDAEAHWCCALCRFGIEYVEDPGTYEYVPTCHRASFDSILQDVDYLAAIKHSDGITRRQYQKDAARIAEVQKGVLAASQNEEPYDVFICYKETDAVTGERSRDSLDAQEVYYRLTEKGCRVFFSRITLEDKAGAEYEPYIFAALNSAKVMIVLGSRPEHFSAVWVKNEWSRFLALMKKDRTRLLIPCYKNMDPYDLPEQLSVLQSYDMTKIGFIQDLIRGVEKVLNADKAKEPMKETVVVQSAGGPNVTALLKRGYLALEDREFDKAAEFFDQILSMDAENGEAYLGFAMAEAKCADRDALRGKYVLPGAALRSSRRITRARQYDKAIDQWFCQLDEEGRNADEKLRTAREQERLARQRQAEEERIAREQREEEKRLRREAVRKRIAAAAGFIAAGRDHTVCLRSDGTAAAIGNNESGQCDVGSWSDLTAVAAGDSFTVGLRSDGTAVAVGNNQQGQCFVREARDLAAVAAGGSHTIGLYADGTADAFGDNHYGQRSVSGWRDLAAVAAGGNHSVGLRSDGTAVAVGDDRSGQCNVKGWRGLVAVAAGANHTVGLRSDGTAVAVGDDRSGQCNVKDWSDLVAVAAGTNHTVGLCSDGRVVAVGDSPDGRCKVSKWSDIAAISAGSDFTVGLRFDGTVVSAGSNLYGRRNVSGWKLFRSIDTVDAERAAIRKAKTDALNKEKTSLEAELSGLKGLFSGKRRKEIEARLAEIAKELKKLS